MKEFDYTIKDPLGLHARPAGVLAKEAKTYASKVTLSANGKTADATRLMAIMAMGVKQGHTVHISVDGADEDAVSEKLKAFFSEHF